MRKLLSYSGLIFAAGAGFANASPFTTTSPTGGTLPTGISAVGGIVLDLTGTNGSRVVSELSASSLFVGFSSTGTPTSYRGNPLTIGIQSGFTPAVIAALGGGLTSASVRISLFDGDTGINDGALASGSNGSDFDAFMDTLRLNGSALGASAGDFSAVTTQNTDANGLAASAGMGLGFRNDTLDTGFFVATSAELAGIYAAVSTGTVTYQLNDLSPDDNFFDFTQGISTSQINVGSPPVVTPPPTTTVPEPAATGLFGLALAALGYVRRRRTVRTATRA